MSERHFLAMDFGAESGRGELVTLSGGKVKLQEIHRFANVPVYMNGYLYWDFPFLFREILATLRLCAERGIELSGIGVDTWGVDFGLLDGNGHLLCNPVCYRDKRTEGIHEYARMSREEVFEATACEPWPISSLYQLLSMERDRSCVLPVAESFLNMPDLFNYFLSGVKRSERTIASTSNLMGKNGEWSRKVIDYFGLGRLFSPLVEPGTVLGPLKGEVQNATGAGEVPVVATCCHDTGGVVASVPGQGSNWAFLSCGTWSILGRPEEKPFATPQCLKEGFSNEYSLETWYMCRNIIGLWIVQELRREWSRSDDPWDYDRMTAEAEGAESGSLVNVSDERFLAPPSMEQALHACIRSSGGKVPGSRGSLVRCVLESLALEHSLRLERMEAVTGRSIDGLYMVGGGTANKLLCRFTAGASGMPVYTGLTECTSLGNGLTQAFALGDLKDSGEIRTVVRESFPMTTYEPENLEEWAEKRETYRKLTGTG